MSNDSNSNWLKNCQHDPLWWLWIVSLLSPVSTMILDLVGVIDRSVEPYSLANNTSWVVFGIISVACAVRGKDLGEDKPMSTGARVFCAVLGVVVAGVALVLGLLPALTD